MRQDKLLFYHQPKTGGSSLRSSLSVSDIRKTHKVLNNNSIYSVIKFFNNNKRGLAMSHCLFAKNSKPSFNFVEYGRDRDWYIFTFVRDPIDHMLSWYFYNNRPGTKRGQLNPKPELTLKQHFDLMAKKKKTGQLSRTVLDNYDKFNFIAVASDENFKHLFSELNLSYKPYKSNASANKGIDYYIENGFLDHKTLEPFKNTRFYEIYNLIKEHNSKGKYSFC